MTDFRALCVELADELEGWIAFGDEADCADAHALVDRARAALAQPAPQGPTDEEILALSQWHEVSYTLTNGSVIYPLQEGTDMKDAVLSFTRAVLQRWGAPAIEPVVELTVQDCADRRPKPPSLKGPTDEELLQVFDTVCLSEGGTVDEIHLRGLHAVLARWGK